MGYDFNMRSNSTTVTHFYTGGWGNKTRELVALGF